MTNERDQPIPENFTMPIPCPGCADRNARIAKLEAYVSALAGLCDDDEDEIDLRQKNKQQAGHIARLREAGQNVAYCMARISPPPYGHACRWCRDCVQRAKDELRAALADPPAAKETGNDAKTI